MEQIEMMKEELDINEAHQNDDDEDESTEDDHQQLIATSTQL